MDLTFVGWIIVGLIAGIISGIIAGGRTLRGWMPSLAIGLIAAWLTGWVLVNLVNMDPVTSIYFAAVIATFTAIILRMIIKTVSFSDN
jgi:uncharacterized membrane protein YeaQ/YmgE (transglycosylase-associated protein family)